MANRVLLFSLALYSDDLVPWPFQVAPYHRRLIHGTGIGVLLFFSACDTFVVLFLSFLVVLSCATLKLLYPLWFRVLMLRKPYVFETETWLIISVRNCYLNGIQHVLSTTPTLLDVFARGRCHEWMIRKRCLVAAYAKEWMIYWSNGVSFYQ